MKRGFTLLELIIVVIILGVLASIAIPRFVGSTERSRTAEAINILGALRAANERYYTANNNVYNGSGTCAGLDTSWSTLRSFETPACTAASGVINMGRLPAGVNGYNVQINAAGCLCCNEEAGTPDCTDTGLAGCPVCT